MFILQFKLVNTNENELKLVPQFCSYLRYVLVSELNTKFNKFKIGLRIGYLYHVPWIDWINKHITADTIINTINKAIKYDILDNNLYVLKIDYSVVIPNTSTSIDRLVRFLEYGDLNYTGLNIFNKLQHKYNYNKLYSLWCMFCIKHLGYHPLSYIIAEK